MLYMLGGASEYGPRLWIESRKRPIDPSAKGEGWFPGRPKSLVWWGRQSRDEGVPVPES